MEYWFFKLTKFSWAVSLRPSATPGERLTDTSEETSSIGWNSERGETAGVEVCSWELDILSRVEFTVKNVVNGD